MAGVFYVITIKSVPSYAVCLEGWNHSQRVASWLEVQIFSSNSFHKLYSNSTLNTLMRSRCRTIRSLQTNLARLR